jgi:uncharacterized membrane protein YoaK (UPF0700 family)
MPHHARTRGRQQLRLATLLAGVAGYVDAYSLTWLGLYVSFMSGNTTSSGMNVGKADLGAAIAPAVAILSFVLGSFSSNFVPDSPARDARRAVMAMVSLCLFAAMAIAITTNSKISEIAVLAFGMGLVNPVQTRVGNEPSGVTFVTGTLNRLGKNVALAVRGRTIEKPEGPRDSYWRRAGIDLRIWGAFAGGATLSGLTTSFFQELALFPAGLVVFALAVIPAALADGAAPAG